MFGNYTPYAAMLAEKGNGSNHMSEIITIERMGYGPEAVGHLASGKTVFVAGAAPGDVVEVDLTDEKPSFARGTVAKLVQSGPVRVAPKWAEPAAAGAAPWQHISYEAQLAAKRDNVIAALARTGGFGEAAGQFVSECLPSKRQWGYRNKIELGAQWDAKGMFNLGFHEEGNPDVVSAAACPVAHDSIAKAPKALRGALRYLQGAEDLGIFRVGVRTSVRTRETEIALWTKPSGFPRAAAAKMLKSCLRSTSVVRVIADPGHARKIKGLEVLDGKGHWEEKLGSARYIASAPSFFQVNTAQAEKLVGCALEALGGSMGEEGPSGLDGMLVADLYAGCGTFGVAMAQAGADVIAVESAGSSVRDLRRNADANAVDIDVIGGDAARELPELGGLDALVVDPPRAGLAAGVAADIAAARAERVIYVSCNPATWARDVRRFESVGYRLESVRPVDLFPQTYHIEVVSSLVRC